METSEKIMTKAYELFKRYGIRSVTMDEIAGQCGVSKKTVYQFYEDKDALVEAILTSIIKKSEEGCAAQHLVADNAIHEIFLSMDMVQELMEGVNPALIYDLKKYHSSAYAKLEVHKQQFMLTLIKQNMERGMAEGFYRSDLKADIIALFQLNSMTLAMESDIFAKTKYSMLDIDYEISLFNLHGLATTKGAKLIEKYKQQRLKQQTV